MRSWKHVALLAVLATASVLGAAPPDVPANLKAKPGQLVRVVVKADEGKLGALRNFTDSEAFWGELVGPKGQRHFVFQAPADGKRAQFVIGWWTPGETEGVATTIEIEGVAPVPPKPDPEPKPKPKPDPDPAPDPVAAAWVIVVEETSQRTPVTAAVLTDLAMWRRVEAKGVKWRLYDKDSADAKANRYDQFAAPVGLPAVLLLDAGGKVVKAVKLPATGAELESLIGAK